MTLELKVKNCISNKRNQQARYQGHNICLLKEKEACNYQGYLEIDIGNYVCYRGSLKPSLKMSKGAKS